MPLPNILIVQLGVNKPAVDAVAAQLQSDSRALRHDRKLHGDFRRKALVGRSRIAPTNQQHLKIIYIRSGGSGDDRFFSLLEQIG